MRPNASIHSIYTDVLLEGEYRRTAAFLRGCTGLAKRSSGLDVPDPSHFHVQGRHRRAGEGMSDSDRLFARVGPDHGQPPRGSWSLLGIARRRGLPHELLLRLVGLRADNALAAGDERRQPP